MRSTWLATAGVALACLPCLLVLIVGAGVGAGVISALGAWFTGNGLVLGAAGATAVAFSLLAWAMYARRAAATACDVDVEEAAPVREGTNM